MPLTAYNKLLYNLLICKFFLKFSIFFPVFKKRVQLLGYNAFGCIMDMFQSSTTVHPTHACMGPVSTAGKDTLAYVKNIIQGVIVQVNSNMGKQSMHV